MRDHKYVKNKILEIIDYILSNSDELDQSGLSINDKLNIIISESQQALEFVTVIEDEFDIELDDDDVDLEFFTNINTLVDRISSNLA